VNGRRLDKEKKINMLTNKIRRKWMGWACDAYGGGENVHRVLVGKPEGKKPLGRPRRRWEDNIKRDLQEVGGGCGDRWRALVSRVMNFRVP
jgi:hypothetical protein